MVSTAKNSAPNNQDSQPIPARPVTPWGILVQQLEQIVARGEAESISSEYKASIDLAYRLAAGLDPYVEGCTTSESAALANLTDRTQKEDWSKRYNDGATIRALEQEMLSGHLEGQFLKMLVAISKSQRVLEVGMFTGYSALAIAEALPEDGYLLACEGRRICLSVCDRLFCSFSPRQEN